MLRLGDQQARREAADRVRERAATVENLLGSPTSWSVVADAFRVGFEQALGMLFERRQPSADERGRAEALIDERYGCEEWTFRV